MIKGGFINLDPIDGYKPLLNKDLWNEKKNQFEIINWNHPQVIFAISKKICKKKKEQYEKINNYKKILLDIVEYFNENETKQGISDKQIINFVKSLNEYLNLNKNKNPLKIIINSSAYNNQTPEQQKEINNKSTQLLNLIDIKPKENYFIDFRQKAINDKELFIKLNKLIGDLDIIKNYQEEIKNIKKIENEEKIYFDYYEKKDLVTFVEKDLEIKKDIKDELLKLTQEYSFEKYVKLYKSMMPINLYNFNELASLLTDLNPPNTNIIIVKKDEYYMDVGEKTVFSFELYNNKLTDPSGQIIYEFDAKKFSIKHTDIGEHKVYHKKETNICMYPYIKKRDYSVGEVYSLKEKILITGMILSKNKKSILISDYYLKLLDKYYTGFISSFLGIPIQNDFIYFKDQRALFLSFVYSAKLNSLMEIFIGSKDKIFDVSIDADNFDNFININKVLDDDFLRNYKEFDNKGKNLLKKLNEIFSSLDLKYNSLYKFIYDNISEEIVVYYNYIIQQNIIKQEEIQTDNIEQNKKKFNINIDKLNNSILYCFDIIKDYIVLKLIIGCIYYNILLRYINEEFILGFVYSLIVDYILNDYNSISNIVNIFNINYDLVGFYPSIRNIKINKADNLLFELEKAYPTLIKPPYFDYQFVEKIKIPGKSEIYPCVEMWLLNLIIYLIYEDEKIKDVINKTNSIKKIIPNEINPELLPNSTKQELKDFFIKSNNNGNIIYYTKNEIIEISKDNRLQKYYKAVHNILTTDQMKKLEDFLSNSKFSSNRISYYITGNVKEQNELPGRYSLLCLLLSKIFGLDDIYSTDELLKKENFSKFYDFNETKRLNEYPNDTLLKIFKLFSTYKNKLDDSNFRLNLENGYEQLKIINDDIKTSLSPEHGHFEYKNYAISDITSINYFYGILFKFKDDSINYNFFNKIIINKIFDKNILIETSLNLNNLNYTYNKNLFDFIVVEITNNPDIESYSYRSLVLELLKNYNTDYNIEYLNLFSNIYYKYYDDLFTNNMIMDIYLNKIVSIDFDNVNKYPIKKYEKCWLSIDDLKKKNINKTLIISIENYKKKYDNYIKTSYISSNIFYNAIKVIDYIIDINKNFNNKSFFDKSLFDEPSSLYLLFLFFNNINDKLIEKVIQYKSENINNFMLYILELVYTYKLFSINNYDKLIKTVNKLKNSDKDVNVKISLIIIVIIMFMPYESNNNINEIITIEEKKELEKINVLAFISGLIEKIKIKYDNEQKKFYGDTIHKIYNTDILKNVFENNFDLDNQQNLYKFVKYKIKDINYPKIDPIIFNIEGTNKLELNGKKYVNYNKYLYILNNVQSEIINSKLMDTFTLTMDVYGSNINLENINSEIKNLYKKIYTPKFFNDDVHALMKKINYNQIIILGPKNVEKQFSELDTDYKIINSYQKIITDKVNDVLFPEKYFQNIFNFHFVIYETFRDISNKYINKISTINELFGNNFLIAEKYNCDEKFLCEFKDSFMNEIKLVYKGGSAMKIIFEKYKKLFEKNIHLNNFIGKFKNDFMRSDADYIILINKKNIMKKYLTFDEKDINMIYNLYYYHLNFIVNILINKLRSKYTTDISFYYDFNRVNYNDLDDSLEMLNEKLQNNNIMYPDSNYSKIKKFIGINFYNRNYIKEKIDNTKKIYIFKNNVLMEIDKNFLNKKPSPKRKDIFITYKHKNNLPPVFINKYKHSISDDDDEFLLLESYTNNKNNDIYIITNESHQYKTWNNKRINFTLHRLKLNSLLYFSMDINDEERYGYINNPVEILDISIPKYNDYFNTDLYDVEENIEENIYSHPYVGEFKYYTYSSKGYIKDLYLNLCVHNEYIWNDSKYEKRLNRLIFFVVVEIITIKNYIEVINDIYNFLQDENKTNLNKFKSKLNSDAYKFFETILCYKNDSNFINFKDKYEKMMGIIYEKFEELRKVKDLDKIKSLTKEELDKIKYFNKYIKYKNKYSLFKNKFNQ